MAKKYRITDAEAAKVLIKNVNDRPNALATYGEAKMTPTQVKDLFDRQFLLVKEKHEALADVVEETEETVGEVAEQIGELRDKLENLDVEETDPTVPEWAMQPNPPTYTKSDVGLGNVDNVKQYSATNPPPYPVTSVNGKSGEVSLGASDVGAMPASTKIPAKTSEITNDSGFITKAVIDLVNYYTKSATYSKDEVNALVSAIPKFAISVVSSLPTSNISATTIYLLSGGSGSNLYTEYIYANNKWEILGSQTVDLTGYATEAWVNVQLSAYVKKSDIDSAISSALATAKESGEFDGQRGTGILKVSTAPTSYTTTTAGVSPIKRMAISTVMKESGVSEVLVGDCIGYSYYLYHIYYVDATYAYMDKYQSIRGATGAPGKDGTDYLLTDADMSKIAKSAADMIDVDGSLRGLSLGIASDGLIYLFVNGQPVGAGIPQGQSGEVFGYVDENNTIVLTGALADGTYNIKYEMDDGSTVDIGGLTLGKTGPTNLADPTSSDWLTDNRLSTSSGGGSSCTGHVLTNYIPAKMGDVVRVKGLDITVYVNGKYGQVACYKSDKTYQQYATTGIAGTASGDAAKNSVTVNGDVLIYTIAELDSGAQRATAETAFIRLDGALMDGYTKNDVIITINEEIA